MSISTKPPAGMRDFLPEALERREYVLDTIRQVYRRHGFRPLETPALERLEILTGKYGDEGDQLMFRVLKRGDKLSSALDPAEETSASDLSDMGLRYDLTVPLCRLVAEYQNELPRVFKAFQLRPVWRADRPARGRFREFYQCDVDFLGTTSVVAEVEALTAAVGALEALGFDDYTLRVNDRRLLAAICTQAGLAPERHAEALIALDKRDKIGDEGVRAELSERGITSEAAATLFALLAASSSAGGTSAALRAVVDGLEGEAAALAEPAVTRLSELFELLAAVLGPSASRIVFDASLARGLGYYTGPIFEVTLPGFSGSVGGGGRYDDLVGMFLGRPVPACGISLGVERLLMIMEERGMFPATLFGRDVFVTQFRNVAPAAGLRLATRLRAAGLEVDVFPEDTQLGKQFKLAEQSGARVVAVIGPDEAEADRVTLKRLATGEQVSVEVGAAAAIVKEWLS